MSLKHDYPHDEPPHGYYHDDRVDAIMFAMQCSNPKPRKVPWYKRMWSWVPTRVTTGATRTVFLTKRYAIKVPTVRNGWKLFLNGLLANIQERQWGTCGLAGICPVVWSIPGGWLVVMPRAKMLHRAPGEATLSLTDFTAFVNRGDYVIPVENKWDSFGILNGELVAIDYGS